MGGMVERLYEDLERKTKELRAASDEVGDTSKWDHPITSLYHYTRRVYGLTNEIIGILDRLIEHYSSLWESKRLELAREYGPGYITVKSVSKKSGKRYYYVVYRSGKRDIYLSKDIVEIRRELRRLRAMRDRYRIVMRKAYWMMKASEEYA